VPIVPLAIAGESAPVLLRGRVLAWFAIWPRLLGLKRWGITVLGVFGAAALALVPWSLPWRVLAMWIWLASPGSLLAWLPTRTRIRIGAPMPASSTRREVEQAIEALL
jgi:hypothetical protein